MKIKQSKRLLFTLKPKKPGLSSDIRIIKVKISDTRKYVKEVKIQYDDENYTLFKFKNPKKSVIDDNIFTFSKKGTSKLDITDSQKIDRDVYHPNTLFINYKINYKKKCKEFLPTTPILKNIWSHKK